MVPSQGHVPFSSETGDILCGAPLPVSIHRAPLHVKRCDILEETASNIFLSRRGQPLSFNEPPSHATDPCHTLCCGLDTLKLNVHTLMTSRGLSLISSLNSLSLVMHYIPPPNTAVCPNLLAVPLYFFCIKRFDI